MLSFSTVPISGSLLNEMKSNGALTKSWEDENDQPVHYIRMTFGDPAWKIYEKWVQGIKDKCKAIIGAQSGTADYDVGSGPLILPHHLSVPVLRELTSIVADFAALEVSDIGVGFRFLPGPITEQPSMRNIDPRLILSPFFEYIQNPTKDYPTLFSLKPGCFIGTVNLTWTGALVDVKVYKSTDTTDDDGKRKLIDATPDSTSDKKLKQSVE